MKIGIYLNKSKQLSEELYSEFEKKLKNKGFECVLMSFPDENIKVDVVAVFGGDGTILGLTEYAIKTDTPIISVNTGTMGFLSTVEAGELDKAVELLSGGNYKLSLRSAVEVKYGNETFYGLNDAVIERGNRFSADSEVVNLDLRINGNLVDRIVADGLIISTPTGSTAYSLSAGGSILTPDLKAFIATPICPHSLHSRPIVFSDSSEAEIYVNSNDCSLCVDGKRVAAIDPGGVVTVIKCEKPVKLIDSGNNFFERLLIKLNKWSTNNQEK